MGAALKRTFQGVIWQRCQVHFMRNVLSFTPARHKAIMAQGLKRIFAAETLGAIQADRHNHINGTENKPNAICADLTLLGECYALT